MYYNFIKDIEFFDKFRLDEENYLLEIPLNRISPYIKTTIPDTIKKLHSITDSILYALTLLRTDKYQYISKVEKILQSILNAQEQDMSSPYYGLWTYDLETDIYTLGFPEKDLTSRIGIPLFVILKEFSNILSEEIKAKINISLNAACFAIVQRNIDMYSSHNLIAETFLTIAYSEFSGISEFLSYGLKKMQNFYYYYIAHGSFYIFNTPNHYNYILVTIHFAKHYINNEMYQTFISDIEDSIWKIASEHYHAQFKQFSGPSARMVDKTLPSDLSKFFDDACVNMSDKNDIFSLKGICPLKYRPYFLGTLLSEYSQNIIFTGCSYPFFSPTQIATTMIQPNYSIGTFSRNNCWTEHSPFLARFGDTETQFYATLTVLNNGFEFTSAHLTMLQHFNYVLGHINFATNGGNRHPNYDLTNGAIKTKDLRIRFEISGDVSKLASKVKNNKFSVRYGNVSLMMNFAYTSFSGEKTKIEFSDDNSLCFDLILYNGKSKKIDFTKLEKAVSAFIFCISESEIPEIPLNCTIKNNKLYSDITTDKNITLQIESICNPDTSENIQTHNVLKIADTPFEQYVSNNTTSMEQYTYITTHNSGFTLNIEDDENDNINDIINSLTSYPEAEFVTSAKYIFSLIEKQNITLSIAKRMAIHLLTKVYEFYKNTNISFETVINRNATNTQLYITLSANTEDIKAQVITTLQTLHSTYLKLTDENSNSEIINKIVKLINDEYSNPDLSLEYIANKLNVSIYVVSRLFKKHTNSKYIDYITGIRIDHAKNMLESTNLSLEEIAYTIGYTNQSSFFRAFKKITNETPSKYKKSIANTAIN